MIGKSGTGAWDIEAKRGTRGGWYRGSELEELRYVEDCEDNTYKPPIIWYDCEI